jgi:Protein of unknown function (DUF4231)
LACRLRRRVFATWVPREPGRRGRVGKGMGVSRFFRRGRTAEAPPSWRPPRPALDLTLPTLWRLDDQIGWYDRKSIYNQRCYRLLKTMTFSASALVPIVANSGQLGAGPTAALLGVLIVLVEGLLQLNQFQQLWIAYRSTAEALKHEQFLFLAHARPYDDADEGTRLRRLAEQVEALVSQEHARWVSLRERDRPTGQQPQVGPPPGGGSGP